MPVEIIDLDAFAGPDKRVKLGGTVYPLPADIPTELYLRMLNLDKELSGAGDDSEEAAIKALQGALLSLFNAVPERDRTKKLTALPPIGLNTLVSLIGRVYAGAGGAGPPRKPSDRPAASKKKTSTARSRSRS